MKLPENDATSTRGVPPFLSDEKTVNDYYPLGMTIADRSFSTAGYRYGFGGKEKVDEISGSGNHNTALFWEYDTRTGRRWNLDPVDQLSVSNYATKFTVPQNKAAMHNYGGMTNKGKTRLSSTAQYGLTIFWKTK